MQAFSAELDRAVISKFDPPLTPDASPQTLHLYLRENANDRYTVLTNGGPTTVPDISGYQVRFAGASRDFTHILFESSFPMAPGAVAGSPNLYEWVGGQLRLVGIRPDGDPAVGGSVVGPLVPAVPGAQAGPYTQTAVSRDGARIAWTEIGSQQLYVRIDGNRTVAVSASQRTNDSGPGGTDPAGPLGATFVGAADDMRTVYFLSAEKLTNDATADVARNAQDLYAYDVDTGLLTDLTVAGPGNTAGVLGLVGASEDGEYVYVAARGVLAPGAVEGLNDVNIYVLHGGGIEHVATVDAADDRQNWNTTINEGGGPKESRVTADGSVAVIASVRRLASYDTAGFNAYYRYDAATGSLACMTCNPRAARSTASAGTLPYAVTGAPFAPFLTRTLSADGSRFFFNTAEALVPRDGNGQIDVYQWENGAVSLISTGQGAAPSYLADASLSGDDVFFVTRERISRADVDDNVDMYDARVNGGRDEDAASGGCSGDDCQGQSPPPPAAPLVGTAGLAGDGNVPRRVRPVRASVRVVTVKAVTGATATLRVRVPAAGRITVTGSSVRRTRAAAAKAGTYTVRVALSVPARKALARKKKLRAAVRVSYQVKGGGIAAKRIAITFQQPKAKRSKAMKGGR
jgi:hypothetical protein